MTRNDIINDLISTARATLQTRLDVEAILALSKQERLDRWLQWSQQTRREFVQLLWAKDQIWLTELEIDAKVAELNVRAGLSAEGLPRTEQAVLEALDELEATARNAERASRTALAALDPRRPGYAEAAVQLKADAKFFARDANSYAKARDYYHAGKRPISLGERAYLLPSQRKDGTPHLLRFDGDWRCSCEAGDTMHWSKAMVIALEVAAEHMDRDDAYVAPEPDVMDLYRRIVAIRRERVLLAA